eukprot:5159879-Prymnesium_polylepis.3
MLQTLRPSRTVRSSSPPPHSPRNCEWPPTLACTLFVVCACPPQDQVYNCAESYNEHCIKLFSPAAELELGSDDAHGALMVSTPSTPEYSHSTSDSVQAPNSVLPGDSCVAHV